MESPRAITKILVPGKRGDLLHRPRLTDFLHENIERKLLLISASAGYGKTSLLIDFAHETPLPVCWYSLDASDADPKTFLEYVVAALRRQFPAFGARTLGLLADAAVLRDVEVVVGALVTEIYETIPRYFVLVLDDYHAVEAAEAVNRSVDTLLRLLPENAHLILSSRTLPSKLTLTRLAARQEIAGLGVNDLRFSADEIRALLRQNYQVELSERDAAELAAYSEGWIAGILLTTHSLWKGLFRDWMRVRGQPTQVFNYLMSEVFTQQPAELQRFLLDSSVLEQLQPELCHALLNAPDAAALLRLVEQKNLFVTRLEEGETWYRYHHLFREFLQTRLREVDAARWHALHRRAAAWFEARGARAPAIAHYFHAELFDDAARAIAAAAKETFDAGRWTTLARWIDALPPRAQDAHPHLLVWRALVLANMGEPHRALELYSHALAIFEGLGDADGIGKTLVKQAVSLRFQGRYQEAIANCQRALTVLSAAAKGDIAEAHRTLGISYGLMGDWLKCIEELELALRCYRALNDYSYIALVYHDLGVAYRTAGSSETAQEHFQQALEYWRHTGNTASLANTLNSVGVGHHRQGNYAQAAETLEEARNAAHRSGHMRIEALALASLGDVYRDQGDYGRAQEAYEAAFDIAQRINEGFVVTYTLNALGETFRLTRDLETAERLIRQAVEQAESHRSDYELGLTTTALGVLSCAQENVNAAVEHLTRAVELLERGGAKRDSARAHLHLANAYFAQRKYRLVGEHLRATAALGTRLREDQFVVAEGRELLPLLQYAATKKIGNGYFPDVLGKIERLPAAPADQDTAAALEVQVPRLEARAFGTAQVFLDDQLISTSAWDSATTKELFFFLLAHPEGLRKEQILNALWGDLSTARANGIFHSTAWRMRRALFHTCLVYADGLYRINPAIDLWYDVEHFGRFIQQASAARTEEERVASYRSAVALYRGDYFEDAYSDWCAPLRAALQRKYLAVLEALVHFYAEHAQIGEAIAACQKILVKDNYREEVYRLLMRLQMRSGDRAGAIETYQRCVQVLRDEMHLAPSPETEALYRRIMSSQYR